MSSNIPSGYQRASLAKNWTPRFLVISPLTESTHLGIGTNAWCGYWDCICNFEESTYVNCEESASAKILLVTKKPMWRGAVTENPTWRGVVMEKPTWRAHLH
jgi:hypothetical protein